MKINEKEAGWGHLKKYANCIQFDEKYFLFFQQRKQQQQQRQMLWLYFIVLISN